MAKRITKAVDLNFAFFTHLWEFYHANRRQIRTHYKDLTKKFLDFNDPANTTSFLRQPQFEALEIYIFLKEFLDNAPVHTIFKEWSERSEHFAGREDASQLGQQLDLFREESKDQYGLIFQRMQKAARSYSNYIFALTMGTGKTILMATCIFYEFILANKYPKDPRYCHNALVFAPDRTVLQSLKEIQTFDMGRVVPPEYRNFLTTHIQFHFLEDAGTALSLIDKSRFNLIISNTQKIILKRQRKEQNAASKLFGSGRPTYQAQSVYNEYADLYAFDEPDDEASLVTNQRFEKLRRIEQLGIYIDEAHHAFGNDLAKDMGLKDSDTSLRRTVDELAASLARTNTHVVACYNYTGTPYVGRDVLPEVVYAFGLQEAINKAFLKKVTIHGYTNVRSQEFVDETIDSFLAETSGLQPEGMMPKLAFFAAKIDELQQELRPAVEAALARHGIPASRILVNVGDEKLTSNDDIREFNRLDTVGCEKQFILLVNKGREGWNCRSLFGVALYRQPSSKIFVLQATMRCLRSVGDVQYTGNVYLSAENCAILDAELQQNFRISIEELTTTAKDKQIYQVRVVPPPVTITLSRIRKQFTLSEQMLPTGIALDIAQANTARYRIHHTTQQGLLSTSHGPQVVEDITHHRERQRFSTLTLVAEIARYLNKPCLQLEHILAETVEGLPRILTAVNEFNELLYDWIIPRLFRALYEITPEDETESFEVELVKVPAKGYYEVTACADMVIDRASVPSTLESKSFHLDTYCFDSSPERELFWSLLRDGRVKHLYFTGMLTHGQSEFYIQYIDPESHTVRSYYPDFLVQKDDDSYMMVEVKGDNKIDDPVVQAKKEFAAQMAIASGMTYEMIKGSAALAGAYNVLFDPRQHGSQESLGSAPG